MVVLLVAGLGVVIRASPAFACSCAGYTPAEAFAAADAVFVGRVVEVDESVFGPIIGSADPVTVTFDVSSVRKGSVPANAKVQTARDGASCGYDFAEGGFYLVHASAGDPLTTGLCSGNEVVGAELATGLSGGYPPAPPVPDEPLWPWGLGLGGAVLLLALAAFLLRRRQRPSTS